MQDSLRELISVFRFHLSANRFSVLEKGFAMTRYLKWGLITRIAALAGFLVAIVSQWWPPVASSRYSTVLLMLGFLVAFIGVFAGRGMFFFKKIYVRLETEELERKKRDMA